jgi:hypothetical protein
MAGLLGNVAACAELFAWFLLGTWFMGAALDAHPALENHDGSI